MADSVYIETSVPSAYVATRADPNKTTHMTVINRRFGLFTPRIVTPEMLWLEES